MMDFSPAYCPIEPIDWPCVPLQYIVSTCTSVALDLGLKQSSPMFTHVRSTERCLMLRESKKSVFFGRALALLDSAVMTTSRYATPDAVAHIVSQPVRADTSNSKPISSSLEQSFITTRREITHTSPRSSSSMGNPSCECPQWRGRWRSEHRTKLDGGTRCLDRGFLIRQTHC